MTVNGTYTYDPSVRINGAGNDVTPESGNNFHETGPAYSLHNGSRLVLHLGGF